MNESYSLNKDKKTNNRLSDELKRLAAASKAGDFDFAVNHDGLTSEEVEAAKLINEAVRNYRAANQYDLMKYKLTSDALSIALWDMNVMSADIVNPINKFIWSQELRHMLGYNDEQDFPNILGSLTDKIHPEDKERAINAFVAHLGDYTGNTAFDIEYRVLHKNGNYRYFHAFGTTQRDNAGTPLRVAGALMDINEKKQAQNQLIIRDNLLQAVNQAAALLLVLDDNEGIESTIMTSMEIIGCSLDADRVHIWRNETVGGEPQFIHAYNWLSETGKQKTEIPIGAMTPFRKKSEWEINLYAMNTSADRFQSCRRKNGNISVLLT